MNAVLDTNILIDYLLGYRQAKKEIDLYKKPMVSLITWMELLVGADSEEEKKDIELFLERFDVLPVSLEIARLAVKIRQNNKIKLPDAIIWATAENENAILVTRNSKDFSSNHPGVRIPYQIKPKA